METEIIFECIIFGLWLAANIVNMATDHYSTHLGWKRALLFATEVLSIMASKNVFGRFKLPIMPGPKPDRIEQIRKLEQRYRKRKQEWWK